MAPRITSERRPIDEAVDAAKKVRAEFCDLDDIPGSFDNIGINLFSRRHPPATAQFARVNSNAHFGPIEEKLRENNYEMDYSIEVIS